VERNQWQISINSRLVIFWMFQLIRLTPPVGYFYLQQILTFSGLNLADFDQIRVLV
jgi:hypothetical protein